jgi:hypothetical protein
MTAVKKAVKKARERRASSGNVVFVNFVDGSFVDPGDVTANIRRLSEQARSAVADVASRDSEVASKLVRHIDALSEAALVFWDVIWELERDTESFRTDCGALLADTVGQLEASRKCAALLAARMSSTIDDDTESSIESRHRLPVSERLPTRSAHEATDADDEPLAPGNARGRSDAVSAAPSKANEPPKPRASTMDMTQDSEDQGILPDAHFDDLDLTDPEQYKIWQERVRKMGAVRARLARKRLIEMGVIREDGSLVSNELPPDMRPESKTSVETG